MIIRAKSPLRISFSGGGTDISPYCHEHGGIVLSATINKYAYASVKPAEGNVLEVNSLDYGMVEKFNAREKLDYNGSLDLVKAVFNRMKAESGAEIYLHSDAPPGSGLGSSSALVVAVIEAINRWKRIDMSCYDIADLAYRIERTDLNISGGYQDQYACTFGGFNFIEFQRNNIVVNPLKISSDVINELQYNLLLCYTGGIRISAKIIDDQISNYLSDKPNQARVMDELKDITYLMKAQLLKGNLNCFGELLHEAWKNKKKMSGKISNAHIDEMYNEALKHGALGGKLLGAGGGGYLLLYCPYHKRYAVEKQMKRMGGEMTDWNFELNGVQSWIFNGGESQNGIYEGTYNKAGC